MIPASRRDRLMHRLGWLGCCAEIIRRHGAPGAMVVRDIIAGSVQRDELLALPLEPYDMRELLKAFPAPGAAG